MYLFLFLMFYKMTVYISLYLCASLLTLTKINNNKSETRNIGMHLQENLMTLS